MALFILLRENQIVHEKKKKEKESNLSIRWKKNQILLLYKFENMSFKFSNDV